MVEYFGTPPIVGLIRQRPWPVGPLTRAIEDAYLRETTPEERKLTPEERNARAICGHCGHFTPWSSDQYTNFGGAGDWEPPDPTYLCARCVAKEICTAMNTRSLPQHWIPAAWEYRVAALIGFSRAGSPGAGWSRWCDKTQPPPNGWVWR